MAAQGLPWPVVVVVVAVSLRRDPRQLIVFLNVLSVLSVLSVCVSLWCVWCMVFFGAESEFVRK